jgi:predicted ATP-grasp superfamily ATP-dependent carboligase
LNTNILLTGGRAPVTLDLARLFSQAGYKVFVAESLKNHLCSYSQTVTKNFLVPPPRQNTQAYISALIDIIKQEKISLLIPTCEEIFYIAAGLNELTLFCQVLTEPLDKLNTLHNKYEFICLVEKIGLLTPKTWLVETQQDLQQVLTLSTTPKKIILKPVYSRFANNIEIFTKPINKIPNLDINNNRPWVAQEFINGQQYCSYNIAHQGQITAIAVYPTIFTDNKGACVYFQAIEHPKIAQWVKTFIEKIKFTGQIAFDFMETSTGDLYPLECNPRAISAIHLFQPHDKLDQAFFNNTDTIIKPTSQQNSMIAMAMFIYSLFPSILSNQFGNWLKRFISSKDVIFRLSDPLPALNLWLIIMQFWQISRKNGISLQQASTQDIEWNGEEIKLKINN